MRIPFIAGNWKMFKTKAEAIAFAEEFRELYKDTDVQTAICAPFTNLEALKEAFAGTEIKVGAQNVHFADEGAFTGEISVSMLEEIGVDFCIVGHSERRQYFGETDETVNKKLKKLFEGPIRPILCVGESLEERDADKAFDVVGGQIKADLEGIDAADVKKLVIAYEPIWAIGTGRTATPDQAEEFNVYSYLKQLIDGNDVSVLLRVADEAVSVMDVLHFYVPTIDQVSNGLRLALNLIRKYLPEGAFSRIYLDEQPVDAGNYVAGALALESSDMNTAGFAMFKIKPKTNGVRMYWAQQAEKPMTAEELQSFNEAAVLEVDGQVVPTDKIRYSYKKSGWGCDATSELPTEPGTYVQTAEIGGNYSCSKISRNITVK